MALMTSWVESANSAETPFPLNNLPYGVYSLEGEPRRLGVAIGDFVLDLAAVADHLPVSADMLGDPRGWNGVMEAGPEVWRELRDTLTLHGAAQGDGFRIGFGTCSGRLLPAGPDPYAA